MTALQAVHVCRRALGVAICAGGALLLANALLAELAARHESVRGALAGGAMAALATAAGTLPVLLSQRYTQRGYDCFLGLGAGVMLAATAFSLVIPALAASRSTGASPLAASLIAGCGIALGTAVVLLLDRLVRPAVWLAGAEAGTELGQARADTLRRAWLFVAAVTIHNMPEGLAIGVAYAGVPPAKAFSLATGIAIQDIPEGLVVAMALRTAGYGRGFAVLAGVASGLIEPVAAVAGALLIDLAASLLPWGLALAAGAMLFVICHEVVPESQRNGHRTSASCALVLGFILMMVLDTSLS